MLLYMDCHRRQLTWTHDSRSPFPSLPRRRRFYLSCECTGNFTGIFNAFWQRYPILRLGHMKHTSYRRHSFIFQIRNSDNDGDTIPTTCFFLLKCVCTRNAYSRLSVLHSREQMSRKNFSQSFLEHQSTIQSKSNSNSYMRNH